MNVTIELSADHARQLAAVCKEEEARLSERSNAPRGVSITDCYDRIEAARKVRAQVSTVLDANPFAVEQDVALHPSEVG